MPAETKRVVHDLRQRADSFSQTNFLSWRGCNHKIGDRFDLNLECIRGHYLRGDNPLSFTLSSYGAFFDLFEDFRGYVNFFLLQDLVGDDY